ncbi:MAG TPA: sigma-70 family RNA polymerase sigma factor [Candidatus Limnocylindrales bacterium]|nr:sigma-70 family RNA polymerase sigma factor [Candidatus Limnocylindrales bacterium]
MTDLRPVDIAPDRAVELEAHRTQLIAHCYRMLGSAFEAEDAVQETMLRAWRALDRFEGRSQLRSWLYRIATNVCLDMLSSRERRVRPMDLRGPGRGDDALPAPLDEATWLGPIPDEFVVPAGGDPAEVALARETVRLAFMAAIQHLPPRQRAVLLLRDVLRWQASEVADLLDTSVAAVNSALQRARETLSARRVTTDAPAPDLDAASSELVGRYVDAFERYDMDALTAVLAEDATWNMPPFDLWLATHDDITAFCLGTGSACRGSRLVPVAANGSPAFGQYKPAADDRGYEPWSLQVLELDGERIVGITFFLDTARLFPLFGLPPRLEGSPRLPNPGYGLA